MAQTRKNNSDLYIHSWHHHATRYCVVKHCQTVKTSASQISHINQLDLNNANTNITTQQYNTKVDNQVRAIIVRVKLNHHFTFIMQHSQRCSRALSTSRNALYFYIFAWYVLQIVGETEFFCLNFGRVFHVGP